MKQSYKRVLVRFVTLCVAGLAVGAAFGVTDPSPTPSPDPTPPCPTNPPNPPAGTVVGYGCSSGCSLTHGCCDYWTYKQSDGTLINFHQCFVVAECAGNGSSNSTVCRDETGNPVASPTGPSTTPTTE